MRSRLRSWRLSRAANIITSLFSCSLFSWISNDSCSESLFFQLLDVAFCYGAFDDEHKDVRFILGDTPFEGFSNSEHRLKPIATGVRTYDLYTHFSFPSVTLRLVPEPARLQFLPSSALRSACRRRFLRRS